MRVKTLVSILNRQVEDRYSSLATELGVPSVGLEILEALYAQDGQQPGQLAQHVGRAATSLTPIIDQIVRRGYVFRQPHPTDKRAVQVFLTPGGRKVRTRLTKFMEESDSELRQALVARITNHPAPAELLERVLAPLPAQK